MLITKNSEVPFDKFTKEVNIGLAQVDIFTVF